eukprot:scaffold2.g6805.t1
MADPIRAVLAVRGNLVAVAVGTQLRVLDVREQSARLVTNAAAEGAGGGRARAPIRVLAFSANGRHLAVGADDKDQGLRIWDTASWTCLHTLKVHKKVSCATFTPDGYLLAGDKFGDVQVARLPQDGGAPAPELEVLLGHYSCVLMSLALSASGRMLATADRDGRLRVSLLPGNLAQGCREIQAYCFGHTAVVTCCAFVGGAVAGAGGGELLVSGSADGTLRLWQPATGQQLSSLQIEAQERERQQEDSSEAPAVVALAVSLDGRHVVAAVDGRDDLLLARVVSERSALECAGWHRLEGLRIPSELAFDASGRLWAAGGPPADDSVRAFLACATVTPDSSLKDAAGVLLPAEVRMVVEARQEGEVEPQDVAPRQLLAAHLVRQGPSQEEIEHRKRHRRDKNQAGQ